VEFPRNRYFTINSELHYIGSEETGGGTNFGINVLKIKGVIFYRNDLELKGHTAKGENTGFGLYFKNRYSRLMFGLYDFAETYNVDTPASPHLNLKSFNFRLKTLQVAYSWDFSKMLFGNTNSFVIGIGGGYGTAFCTNDACRAVYPDRKQTSTMMTNLLLQYGITFGFLELVFDWAVFDRKELEIVPLDSSVSNYKFEVLGNLYAVGLGLSF